jgi:hypothetical protein
MSVLLSSITYTGQNDFITRSLLGSNMVKGSTASSTDHFHTDLCGDHSTKVAVTAAQVAVQDIGQLLRQESFILLYINTLFPTLKQMLCRHGFPNHCWDGVITRFIVWLVLSLRIETLATKLSSMDQLLITVIPIFTHHITNNEKMQPWMLACRSFVMWTATHCCQVI